VLISDNTNYIGRFQYPLLVLAALSLPPLWVAISREVTFSPLGRAAVFVVVLVSLLIPIRAFQHERRATHDGLANAGLAFAPLASRGYTLVTSEAGLIPFYSRWRTIDAWGLNDPTVVHHGLTEAYLDTQGADVIMVHSPSTGPGPHGRWLPGWNAMVATLQRYAASRGFVRAAAFGTVDETWNFYVRSALPDACDVARRIRAIRFVQPGTDRTLPDLVPGAPACVPVPGPA
jgi:hypothetical protein